MISEPSIDHVTVAWRSLDRLSETFAAVDLEPEYGGRHDGMPTEMSTVGFPDGSYIELIAKYDNDAVSPLWDDAMEAGIGPCAWALRVADIAGLTEAIERDGIPVQGPDRYQRRRPDGTVAKWRLTFLGDGEPGEFLPFLIEDDTPREQRIQPTVDSRSCELRGVAGVVLAVPDLTTGVGRLERLFSASTFEYRDVRAGPLAGRQATAEDIGVTVLAPADDTAIAARLRRYGRGPCAFVLRSEDLDVSSARFTMLTATHLGPAEVHLVDPDALHGLAYLGVTAAR